MINFYLWPDAISKIKIKSIFCMMNKLKQNHNSSDQLLGFLSVDLQSTHSWKDAHFQQDQLNSKSLVLVDRYSSKYKNVRSESMDCNIAVERNHTQNINGDQPFLTSLIPDILRVNTK